MNRKKILLSAAALVITAAGVFGAIKKSSPSTIFFKSTGGVCHPFFTNSLLNFTSSSVTGNQQAAIRTKSGASEDLLFSTSACGTGHLVYFKS